MYAANPLDDTESKQSAADRFMRYAIIGAVVTIVVIATTWFGPLPQSPRGLKSAAGLSLIAMIYALVTMYRTRLADEYVERMWNAGTSAAFVAVIAFTLLQLLLVAGVLAIGRDPLRLGWLIVGDSNMLHVALIAFFAAVLIKRVRGS